MILTGKAIKKRHYVRTDEFRTNCPFCSDTKSHLYVNTTKGCFYCFRCNVSGRFIDDDTSIHIQVPKLKPSHLRKIEFLAPTEEHLSYLRNRGMTMPEIVLFSPACYTNYKDYVFSQYSLPLVGRNVKGKEPKYMILSKEKHLWGVEYCERSKPIIIVEGVFDLFGVRRSYPNVVATLGKTISQTMLTMLYCLRPPEVIVILDSDVKDVSSWRRVGIYLPTKVYKLREGDPWENRHLDYTKVDNDDSFVRLL